MDGTEVSPVSSAVFLGVLVGFAVSTCQTLTRSLSRAMNTYWSFAGILIKASTTPVRGRLKLLTSFVTSRWRWMAPAVRPSQNTSQTLRTAHPNLLLMMCGLQSDQLMPVGQDWVARRRAARAVSQHCTHVPWLVVHLTQFWNYWGHAGRNATARNPTVKLLRMYDARWKMLHPDVRHLRGNWTDTDRYLQDQWYRMRPRGDPLFWDEIAQDRARWKLLLQDLLRDSGFRDGQWYPALDAIELCGRQLLVTDTSYQLLPARHFPPEDLFETSFKVVPQVDAYDVQDGWHFACDGSSQNEEGGYAVVIRPPGQAHEAFIIRRGMVPSPCNFETFDMYDRQPLIIGSAWIDLGTLRSC